MSTRIHVCTQILATKSAGYHIAEALTSETKYDVADEEARLANFQLKPDDEGMRKTEDGGVEFDHEQLDGANKYEHNPLLRTTCRSVTHVCIHVSSRMYPDHVSLLPLQGIPTGLAPTQGTLTRGFASHTSRRARWPSSRRTAVSLLVRPALAPAYHRPVPSVFSLHAESGCWNVPKAHKLLIFPNEFGHWYHSDDSHTHAPCLFGSHS